MEAATPMQLVLLMALGALVWLVLMGLIFTRLYRRVRPGQALVVFGGRRGLRIVRERGTFVFPIIEDAATLDLTERSLLLALEGVSLAATDGTRRDSRLEVKAQYALEPTEEALRLAAERFLGRPPSEIEQVVRGVLEGHVRSALAALTVQDLRLDPARAADLIQAGAKDDLGRLGVVARSVLFQTIA